MKKDYTWEIQAGIASCDFGSEEQAKLVVDEIQSLCGARLERDREYVYCAFALSWSDLMKEDMSEEDAVAESERTEEECKAELEKHGFKAEVRA